jgi:hypothetical protein
MSKAATDKVKDKKAAAAAAAAATTGDGSEKKKRKPNGEADDEAKAKKPKPKPKDGGEAKPKAKPKETSLEAPPGPDIKHLTTADGSIILEFHISKTNVVHVTKVRTPAGSIIEFTEKGKVKSVA